MSKIIFNITPAEQHIDLLRMLTLFAGGSHLSLLIQALNRENMLYVCFQTMKE